MASTNEVQLIIPKSIQARFVPYSCGAVSKTERAVGFTSIIIFGFGDLDGLDFFHCLRKFIIPSGKVLLCLEIMFIPGPKRVLVRIKLAICVKESYR